MQLVKLLTVLVLMVKEGHTAKERRRGAHLHYIGCWARKPLLYVTYGQYDARSTVTFQSMLVLLAPTDGKMARLRWPGWLVTYRDSLPARRRSPIQILTGPSVE